MSIYEHFLDPSGSFLRFGSLTKDLLATCKSRFSSVMNQKNELDFNGTPLLCAMFSAETSAELSFELVASGKMEPRKFAHACI